MPILMGLFINQHPALSFFRSVSTLSVLQQQPEMCQTRQYPQGGTSIKKAAATTTTATKTISIERNKSSTSNATTCGSKRN